MAMKLVKKTAEFSIFKRIDDRYAVRTHKGKAVDGDEKVAILAAEGLITLPKSAPKEEPAEEAEATEEAAEEEPAAE